MYIGMINGQYGEYASLGQSCFRECQTSGASSVFSEQAASDVIETKAGGINAAFKSNLTFYLGGPANQVNRFNRGRDNRRPNAGQSPGEIFRTGRER